MEGSTPEPLAAEAGEKPGVEFRKPRRTGEAKEEPKAYAPGTPKMEDALIMGADAGNGELVVDPKDGGGAWTIDLMSARFLTFPKLEPAVAPQVQKAEWRLRLAGGVEFGLVLTGLRPPCIEGRIAGLKVSFPASAVASLERLDGSDQKPAGP
jgi:hypothetical protein